MEYKVHDNTKFKVYNKQNIGLLFSWSEKHVYELPHTHTWLMKKTETQFSRKYLGDRLRVYRPNLPAFVQDVWSPTVWSNIFCSMHNLVQHNEIYEALSINGVAFTFITA